MWSDTLILVYYGQCAFWLPKPPTPSHPVYIVLMNETTSMTASDIHLLGTVPVGAWFTDLAEDTQADITDMVNEQGYPLDDIRDFVEQYGEEAYCAGHYVTWCELTEQIGASNDAIEAYVDEVGIDNIDGFEDAYVGEYESEADFAQQHFDEHYSNIDALESAGMVIDWQATWDTNLQYDFTYNNGFVFNSHN